MLYSKQAEIMTMKYIYTGAIGALWFAMAAFAQAKPPPVLTFELENASRSNGCEILKRADASNGFAIGGFKANPQAEVSFKVDIQHTGHRNGKQSVMIRYKAPDGNVPIELAIAGGGQKVVLPSTEKRNGGWGHLTVTATLFAWKVNEVIIRPIGIPPHDFELDYFAVGNVTAPATEMMTLQPIPLSQETIAESAAILKERGGIDDLLVIVRNFIHCTHTYTYYNEGFRPGGGLYRFDKNGLTKLIDTTEGQILDAKLSYDATQVLFSWRKDAATNYDIYLMNVDGSDVRQLTHHPAHDFNPTWLPDGGIAFLSDRDSNFAYCMGSSSAVLYRMESDSTRLKRLSANYLNDIAPHIMHNGKILYTRWEYVDRFQIPSQGLWAQNPDGTGLAHIYGGRMIDPVMISEAKSIPGTKKLLVTLTGHGGTSPGSIGVVDPSAGANNPAGLTEVLGQMVRLWDNSVRALNQRYEYPIPIDDQNFLVSYSGDIQIADYAGKNVQTLLRQGEGPTDAELGYYAAIPIKPRVREPVIQSGIDESQSHKMAQVVMQDVYIGLEKQLADGIIKRGEIKQIRIIESLGKQNRAGQAQAAFCWQFPVVSGGATMEPKKTLSVVNVEADGSAMFEVPPMKAVFFQALDKDGRVIQRMRTFTQFMGGEVQSCTGCHMDRNTATPNNKAKIAALQKPIQKVNGAPWQEHPNAFSYQEQVQTVWDKHCVQCHNPHKKSGGLDLSGDRTDLFNMSYDHLVRTDVNKNPTRSSAGPQEFKHQYISYIPSYNGCEPRYMAEKYFLPKSWGSYPSPLTQLIHRGHPDQNGIPRIDLSDLEKRQVYAWVDYNVPYYQTSHTSYPKNTHGMRELVPEGFYDILKDVEARRCARCHNKPQKREGWFNWANKTRKLNNAPQALPLEPFLRWEKPELNNFMLAPLAEAAGGTPMGGHGVFADKNDPDYQKMLHAFDDVKALQKTQPRMDWPGAKEVRVEGHSPLYECLDMP